MMVDEKFNLTPQGIDPTNINDAHCAIIDAVKSYENLVDACHGILSDIKEFADKVKLPHTPGGLPISISEMLLVGFYNLERALFTTGFYWFEELFGAGSTHHECMVHLFHLSAIIRSIKKNFTDYEKWPPITDCLPHLSVLSAGRLETTPELAAYCSQLISKVRWDDSMAVPLAKSITGYSWNSTEDLFGLEREYSCALWLLPSKTRAATPAQYTLQDLTEDVRGYDHRKSSPFLEVPIKFQGAIKNETAIRRRLDQCPTIFQRLPSYRLLEGYVNAKYGKMDIENLLRIRGEVCLACQCDTVTADNMPLLKLVDILLSGAGNPVGGNKTRKKGAGRTVESGIVNWRRQLREEVDKAFQTLGKRTLQLAVEHIADTNPELLFHPTGKKRINLAQVKSELGKHAKYLKSSARKIKKSQRKIK